MQLPLSCFLLLLSCAALWLLLQFFWESDHPPPSSLSPLSPASDGYLYGWLFTVDSEVGGVGNNVFELLAFIGIANKLNRIPVISVAASNHLAKSHKAFERLLDGVQVGAKPLYALKVGFAHDCCAFSEPISALGRYSRMKHIAIDITYGQSYKYFVGMGREEVRSRLKMTKHVEEIARDNMVDPALLKASDHVICVHSRRGDYVQSTLHAHSNELFTIPAIRFIFNRVKAKGKRRPVIVLIGDDKQWESQLLRKEPFQYAVAQLRNASAPPEADWEFSRQYCHSVLLTASASTFGWFLGYNSRGYDVYYNTVFSKPGGMGATFNGDDFFPVEWTPLEYDTSTRDVGVRPPRV